MAARRWKGGSRLEPPLYLLSEDDLWCDDTRRRIALAIGNWLIAANATHRRIESLQLWELEAVAEAATVEYTKARCERYDQEERNQSSEPRPDRLVG